ncbi:serine hydrolase domain-containing protein [Flavobacterium lindanitolerans]|uniref:serine hydrolase domain-containing protein n=1 Tax=Flavobacterium lindanitolerans TaxID=428988 RepID=UPI0027BB0800|nr:serine hydrolase domain-containing protein [Flavobacterium lindanitolerans]
MNKSGYFTFFLLFALLQGKAQVEKTSELYKTIMSKDSLLFNIGFNTCDVSQFENLMSEKLEFFHDIDGISDKKKFLKDFKGGLCRNPKNYQARRELLSGSTEIYALYEKSNGGKLYGALQTGIHQFFEKETGQPEKFGSSARFSHLWLLENGEWKLVKSYSYEHVTKQLESAAAPVFDDDIAVEEWLKNNKVPVLGLGIIKNGELQQLKVFGEIKPVVPAPYNTIFNVASLTKPVTAMVALKLVSLGKWDLDKPIYNYWTDPDITKDPRSKKITTRHVLSHQTGFPNWRWMNADKKLSFLFEPGNGYQYSGEGFEYLRRALENKFHKSLQQLASELIFQPLKMDETSYVWNKNTDESRYALGYDKELKPYAIEKHNSPNAADDLLTTVEDYGKFLAGVMNGELVKESVFNEMVTPQTASERSKHFGLGFEIYDLENGEYALAHGGADSGVRTMAFILPKTKQALLIFTNSDVGGNLYEVLVKYYLGKYGEKIIDVETK